MIIIFAIPVAAVVAKVEAQLSKGIANMQFKTSDNINFAIDPSKVITIVLSVVQLAPFRMHSKFLARIISKLTTHRRPLKSCFHIYSMVRPKTVKANNRVLQDILPRMNLRHKYRPQQQDVQPRWKRDKLSNLWKIRGS